MHCISQKMLSFAANRRQGCTVSYFSTDQRVTTLLQKSDPEPARTTRDGCHQSNVRLKSVCCVSCLRHSVPLVRAMQVCEVPYQNLPESPLEGPQEGMWGFCEACQRDISTSTRGIRWYKRPRRKALHCDLQRDVHVSMHFAPGLNDVINR